jgi:hypothetical protein
VTGRVSTARALRRGLTLTALVLGVALFAGPSAADHGPGFHALSISDVTVAEGTGGTVTASFDVMLTAATLTEDVTVTFATGDATARAPDDYASVGPITLTFPALTTTLTQSVDVSVEGDALDEAVETFVGNLSNVSANASIADD